MILRHSTYFFGGGFAFFAGIACILCGTLIFAASRSQRMVTIARSVSRLGLLLILVSAVPIPYLIYGVGFAVTAFQLHAEKSAGPAWQARRIPLRWGAVIIWLFAVGIEIPYHLVPAIKPARDSTLCVVADSITAGLGEGEAITWPKRLRAQTGIQVRDVSEPGATAKSAWKQAARLPDQPAVVLLEIGGNDMLGFTSSSQFRSDLDALLNRVCQSNRTVVMFELPLPPFCNEFGRHQRELAAKYGVMLIPKRVLINILTTDAATLDTIHLSQTGHDLMAETIWRIVEPAFGNATTETSAASNVSLSDR